jgi:hypothetical protein
MSLPDEGNFDLVIEVAQSLLLDVAEGINIPSTTTTISFAGLSGPLTVVATVDGVSLGACPNLNVSISLDGTTFVATTVPIYLSPVPQSLRTVGINGDVACPVPLSIVGLALVADFTNVSPIVSQDVFNSVLAAPLFQFLLAETILIDPTGGTFTQVVLLIERILTKEIRDTVASIGQLTLIDFSSFSTALAGAIGTGITAFSFKCGDQSIFLLFTIGGTPGSPNFITRSNLLRTSDGQVADRADLIWSNGCLLRDVVKPILIARLGLSPGGFAPPALLGAPFAWGGSAPFPSVVGGPVSSASITSVIVGVDGTNLRLLVSATAGGVAGSFTVNASIDITISFSASISNGILTLTFTPVGTPVVNSNVSIAWWVYVIGWVVGGFTLDVIIAITNALAGNIANGIIAGAIGGALGPISVPIPLPPGTPPLSVRQVSLFQADAFPSLVAVGGFIIMALPFPENDIIMNFI